MSQTVDHPETENFAEAMENSLDFRKPESGELLKGTIVSINGDETYIVITSYSIHYTKLYDM